ncbi:MAG: tRNA-queuosine alpha-mannosyltransferase domain-containing protein [Saccharospirillum sp.]
MNILLLSAYHSASHRYWCEGLMQAFPEHRWTLKTQPARHFSWRVQASGLIWGLAGDADFRRPYDLIIATSLTDLAPIKASCPALQSVPLWLYFHENQFAHPLSGKQQADHQIAWQFQSIENALLADWVSFNTRFNRDSFLSGAQTLLKRLPEPLPGRPMERLARQSDVLPVPLSGAFRAFRAVPKEPDLIVWNHRWEWDKQPNRFLKALTELSDAGVPFRLAMMGSGGGRTIEFDAFRERLADRLVHWGQASTEDYAHWLSRAGIGVSTSLHDFQGLSMLELAQAGATVVVPNRLAYPDSLPGAAFYPGSEQNERQDIDEVKVVLAALLSGEVDQRPLVDTLPEWTLLRAEYAERLRFIASMSGHRRPPGSGR